MHEYKRMTLYAKVKNRDSLLQNKEKIEERVLQFVQKEIQLRAAHLDHQMPIFQILPNQIKLSQMNIQCLFLESSSCF